MLVLLFIERVVNILPRKQIILIFLRCSITLKDCFSSQIYIENEEKLAVMNNNNNAILYHIKNLLIHRVGHRLGSIFVKFIAETLKEPGGGRGVESPPPQRSDLY